MLKTNNKKVNEYFKSIIIQSLTEEELNNYIEDYNNNAKEEYNFNYNNIIDFISNYYGGHCLITCWYSEMRKDLKMALEETEEEANKYSDDKVAQLYYTLLERALFNVFEIEIIVVKNRANQFVKNYKWKF